MMQQATQLIPRMEPGYSMDAVLRVRNCLYAHYVGPMSQSGLASQKLNIMAFEHELGAQRHCLHHLRQSRMRTRALLIPFYGDEVI